MGRIDDRKKRRQRIRYRIRKVVSGTAQRPRLAVFRSLRNVYAQMVDDVHGVTLVSASTREPALREGLPHGGNRAAGQRIGRAIAERAQAKGITAAVLDRGGFRYHGVVKELAEAARAAGLKL